MNVAQDMIITCAQIQVAGKGCREIVTQSSFDGAEHE